MRLIASILLASVVAVSAQIPPNVMQELLAASVISASAVWAPTNAYGWWHADSITAANGALVTNWTDSAGSHPFYVFGQNDANAPYLTNNIINGKPAIVWSTGAADLGLTNAFGTTLAQPLTIFMVAQLTDVAGTSSVLLDSISSSPRLVVTKVSGSFTIALNGGTSQTAPSTYSNGAWYVWTFFANQANSYVRTNGVTFFNVSGSIGTAGSSGITIGTRFALSASSMKGKVAELILFNGAMNTNDLQWVENNLKSKYGL